MGTENDPLVLYIVIRESLNMSPGKAVAQGGHAVEKFLLKYFRIQIFSVKKDLNITTPDELEHVRVATEWIGNGSRKVVLRADEKEWETIKSEMKDIFIIKDAGLTEVEPGTETALALWPQRKSSFSDTVIRNLSVYK